MQKQIRSGDEVGRGTRLITGWTGNPLVNQLAIQKLVSQGRFERVAKSNPLRMGSHGRRA